MPTPLMSALKPWKRISQKLSTFGFGANTGIRYTICYMCHQEIFLTILVVMNCKFWVLQDFSCCVDSLWEDWWCFCFMVGILNFSMVILKMFVIYLSEFSPSLCILLCFHEGFQCTVKLSWHFLYTCGTLKQRYESFSGSCNLEFM